MDLRSADASKPYNSEVVSALTRALWASNRPDEAEKYLAQLLRVQPTFLAGYSELNRFYLKTNRLQDDAELLQRAIENVPTRYEFYYDLARLYLIAKKRPEMYKTWND